MIFQNKNKIASFGLLVLFVVSTITTGLFQLCLKPDGRRQFEFIFEQCSDALKENKSACHSCDCGHSKSQKHDDENSGAIFNSSQCFCVHLQIQPEELAVECQDNETAFSIDAEFCEIVDLFPSLWRVQKMPGPAPPLFKQPYLLDLSTVVQLT